MLASNIRLATMASNPVIFCHKFPIFKNTHIRKPKFHIVNNATKKDHVTSLKVRSFLPPKSWISELGLLRNRLNLGQNVFRVGSGGGGSGGAGSGGGGGGSGGGGGGGNKWSFIAWYLALLESHPVLTKAVTSALLTLVGDVICQVVIDQAPSLDLKRVSLFTFLGMALVGPTLHFWYLYLSKLVTMSGASGALLRLVIDQFIFAPAFIGVFLINVGNIRRRPSQVMPKLQQEWLSSVIANWQLWIPFQFLNFRFVPQQFQVLAANFIALVWNVIFIV